MTKSIALSLAANFMAVGPAFAHHGPEHAVSSSQTAYALCGLMALVLIAAKVVGSTSHATKQRPEDIT